MPTKGNDTRGGTLQTVRALSPARFPSGAWGPGQSTGGEPNFQHFFVWVIKSGSNSNRFFLARLKHLCCVSGVCVELGKVISDGDIIKCQHVFLNKVLSMGRSR